MNTLFGLPRFGSILILAIISGCANTEKRQLDHHFHGESSEISSEVAHRSRPARDDQDIDSSPSTSPIQSVSYPSQEHDVVASISDELAPPEPDSLDVNEATDGLTLASLEQMALAHNPAIQQVSYAVSKSAGIRTQVGLRPNPSIGYFGEEIGNDSASGLHGAFLSQTFVRGGKLKWNRHVIGHDIEFARWQREAQQFRVRNDIRIQFYAALGAQKRLELARDFRLVAKKAVDVSQTLLQTQQGSRPDVLQSEIQLGEIDLAIQRAGFEFDAAWNELVAVAGLPGLAPTNLMGDLESSVKDRDMDATYEQIVAQSPVLAAACVRVRRARANLQRQRIQAIPNVNAQIGVGYDDGTGDEFANIQLAVPLPVHNWNQGNIRAAHAEYCAATQNVERVKLQIRQVLAQTIRSFQVAQATVRQYETSILPKAGTTLKLMQKAMDAGEYDFLRVLTARRAFFDAKLRYVAALTDLAQANTRIDGLLLTGGLDQVASYNGSDELRGAALSGQ